MYIEKYMIHSWGISFENFSEWDKHCVVFNPH